MGKMETGDNSIVKSWLKISWLLRIYKPRINKCCQPISPS